MNTCNCFACQCGMLLDENKISEQTYYGMLLGYYFSNYIQSKNFEDIFEKCLIKFPRVTNTSTIKELVGMELNTKLAKHNLDEYRRQYKIFDELVAKALGEKE